MGDEVKINFRNVIVGIIIMCGCVYVGAISAMPHQSELVTKVINIPVQLTQHQDIVTEGSVDAALNQSNNGVLNTSTFSTDPVFDLGIKIFIIVGAAFVVFSLMNFVGLVPRFGGMGD